MEIVRAEERKGNLEKCCKTTGGTTGMVGERGARIENEVEARIGMERGGNEWKTFLGALLGSRMWIGEGVRMSPSCK